MRILMLVANSVYRDPRVVREARALAAVGHTVMVAGIEEDSGYPEVPRDQPFEVTVFRRRQVRLDWVWPVANRIGVKRRTDGTPRSVRSRHGILRSLHAAQLFLSVHWSFVPAIKDLLGWKPDVVHSHDLNTLRTATLLGKLARVPVVYDAHEIWSELGDYNPGYKRLLTLVERRLLRRGVSRVITVSESIAGWMEEKYHIERPVVIVNSPDCPDLVQPRTDRHPLSMVVFLYQGALTAGRGLEFLVTAFRYVRSDASLLIRGTGPLRHELESIIATHSIKKVRLVEPIAPGEVVRLAAEEADIGVIPFSVSSLNNYLALPNKLFEYMAAGLAILSVDIPEIRRIQDKCSIGWLYRETTPENLANKIDQIVAEGNLRLFKENSYRLYSEEFRWPEVARKLVKVYDDLRS